MSNATIGAVVIGVLFALYQAIRGFLLNRDIGQAEKKTTLLQTIIDAKGKDIAVDETKVKETSDAYEDNKRNYDNNVNKPK